MTKAHTGQRDSSPKALLPRPATRLLAALVTAGGLVLATAVPASAHDELVAASPEAGGTLPTVPSEITLTFSGELLEMEGAAVIEVTGEDGRDIAEGPPEVEGTAITQQLSEQSGAGAFTVRWRVVSSDGHPISDEYSYTVEEVRVSPGPASDTDGPTPGADDEEQTPEQSPPPAEAAEGEGHGEATGGGALPPVLIIGGGALLLGGAAFAIALAGRDRRSRDAAAARVRAEEEGADDS